MGAVWRWGVGIWTAVVIIGGGLTLWLREEIEPPPPVGWERTDPSATPHLPRCPVPELPPDVEDGTVATSCILTAD
ncbi:hypothetical protein [Streptomyces sp. NRRL S-37]|uniref:hypothetical protein n=1 Tax=Streptomyces sp. NRRL S-37 TaxID=1463903 RepID=UPI000561C02F|nr:hypothetical protein [Streptomyces sp. NRRL S-37]